MIAKPAASGAARVARFETRVAVSLIARKHLDFDALLAEIEEDPAQAAEFAGAGTWVAENFYGDQEPTLKLARLRKGLSQKQLAAILGTSQPHVANLEKGCNDPMFSTVQKLAKALEISLEDVGKMIDRQRQINEGKAK